MAGDSKLTWALWSSAIESSNVLTADGKGALRRAVSAVAGFLGADWLADAHARQVSDIEARKTGLPFMSFRWWPDNDVRHVHQRLLTLGARLLVVAGTPGLVQVRRDLTRDLGHFAHGLMQIEVAALAKRSGRAVALEPKTAAATNKRADVLIDGSDGAMLVETKMFRLNEQASGDLAATDRVMAAIRQLEWTHDVQVTGDLSPVDDAGKVEEWIGELGEFAARAARLGIALDFDHPLGKLRISPGAGSAPDEVLSVPIRSGDEWLRIRSQIAKKSEQGRGALPLWLRFDQTPEFWSLSAPAGPPHREWVHHLASAIERELDEHDHVAGVVLSAPPFGVASGGQNIDVNVGDRSVVLGRTVAPLDWRETLIVPAASERGVQPWLGWYQNESDWLSWALDCLDLPPLPALFTDA